MHNFFSSNLKYLRKAANLNQSEIQDRLGFKRNTWSNWENSISVPAMGIIVQIAEFFDVDVDDLFKRDLSNVHLNENQKSAKNTKKVHLNVHPSVHPLPQKAQNFRVEEELNNGSFVAEPRVVYGGAELPKVVTVDSSGRENISYVSVKARAGYLLGFGDPAYIEKLPAFTVPGYTHGTYRLFEVDGHSMFPTLQASDRVITRWAGISEVRDDRVYVIVTKNDGVLIKRIINRYQEGKIIAKSDNNHGGEFPALVLDLSEISEIWYVVERWTRQLPGPGEIYKRIVNLEAELALLKHRLNQSG